MSSLLEVPERAASGGPTAAPHSPRTRPFLTGDLAVGGALVAGLTLLAFVTTGGVALGGNTGAEIVLVLIGCGLAVAQLLLGPRLTRPGTVALLLFAALSALTAISIVWSVQPENSWLEANRTLAYLAVFGGGIVLARLAGDRWRVVLGAITVTAVVLCGYALLVKVFPASLDAADPVGRLRAPFDYWNATGLMAAIGLPGAVWAGARRDRAIALRAASVPAIAVLLPVLLLTYSRSALAGALCALAVWFWLVPLRLRGALVLGVGVACGGAVSAWALGNGSLTRDSVALSARVHAGHEFGLVLLAALVVASVAGVIVIRVIDRSAPSPALRRRAGIVLLVAVALVPVVGVGALAASSRGLGGQISHAWQSLTNPNSVTYNTPGRLVQLGSSRPRYWSEGLQVGEHSPWYGVGAAGYGTASARYVAASGLNNGVVAHAHSYPIETFADFGLIGVVLTVALLAAWGIAVARTVGPRGSPREGSEDVSAEQAALLTLLCMVVAFGVSSTIDWTWFVPGTAVPALLAAGWLAGRGPLARPAGRLERRRRVAVQPWLGAAIAVTGGLALLCSWAIWQPLRSNQSDAAAVSALARGNAASALTDATTAAARDPLAIEPLWTRSAIFNAAGDLRAARAQLVKGAELQPQNPAAWQQLGLYDLDHSLRGQAVFALRRARMLAPTDGTTSGALQQAVSQRQPRR